MGLASGAVDRPMGKLKGTVQYALQDFLPTGRPTAYLLSSSSSSSFFFFFFFFPTTVLITRTFGRPNGLCPSTQRSSNCSRAIRSDRFNTLRERERRLPALRLLSIVTKVFPGRKRQKLTSMFVWCSELDCWCSCSENSVSVLETPS
jgi:hypothetical protein